MGREGKQSLQTLQILYNIPLIFKVIKVGFGYHAVPFSGHPSVKETWMIGHKNVTTNRLWLRDDIDDALDRLDEQCKLSAFFESTPNGSAIEQYLKSDRAAREEERAHEPDYRFFYDHASQKADYLAVWAGIEKYPTVIRHTVNNVTPDEAKTIDALTTCTSRCSPAQFNWAVAELEIQSQLKFDSAG